MRSSAIRAVAARAGSIVASFGLTLVVARVLGLTEAGIFFTLFTAIAVASTLGRFGTDTLALKLVSGSSPHPRHDVRQLFITVTLLSIITTLLGGALLVAVGGLGGASALTLGLACGSIAGQALAVLASAVLRARGRLVLGTFAELGSLPLIALIVLVVGWAAGRSSLEWALGAVAIGSWTTAAWAVALALRSLHGADSSGTPLGQGMLLRRHLGSLAAMMGTALLFLMLTWAPVFVLSALGRFHDVSLYTAAARLIGFLTLVPAIQVSYLAPAFAKLFHEQRTGDLNQLAGRSAAIAFLVSVAPAAVLIGASGWVLTLLFGPEYVAAGTALVLLTAGALFTAFAGQVNQLMLLCDLERSALLLNAGLLAIWLVGGLATAHEYGLTGVAVVSLVGTVVYNATAILRLRFAKGIISFARVVR